MLSALADGPARLSADKVAASQRRRMLAAMVAAVAEKGYVGTSVADVISRARVSRATFYEQFADKGDCFMAAFHECVAIFVEGLRESVDAKKTPRDRLRAILTYYLGSLAEFPEGARVCLVETYAAGPEAAAQRRQIQLDFVAVLQENHDTFVKANEPVRSLTRFDFEAIVAAISSLATNRVAMGETDDLPRLRKPLEAFILRHYGLDD